MIKNRRLLFKQFLALFFFTQILIFSFSIISCPSASAQSESQLTESLNFKPQVSIPLSEFTAKQEVSVGKVNENTGKMESDLLGRYMLAIVNYALAAVAILATVVLMGGGLLWLTSRGDSSQVGKAKGLIGGSLTGMILLLCSWIILNTINPKLTEFQSIDTTVIHKVITGCCEKAKDDGQIKMTTSENCSGNFYQDRNLNNGKCEDEICCLYNNKTFPTLSRCFRSFPGACNKFLEHHDGQIIQNICSEAPQCKGLVTLSCEGIKDGEKVSNESLYSSLICYGGLLYWNQGGLLSEPCGISSSGYGICVDDKNDCNDTNQLGGRRCGTGLKCCLD